MYLFKSRTARIVEILLDYKWSIYPVLIRDSKVRLIDNKIILKFFKLDKKYKLYKEFVKSKLKLTREQSILKIIKSRSIYGHSSK